MTYPNVHEGMEKIHKAEIIIIITSVIELIIAVAMNYESELSNIGIGTKVLFVIQLIILILCDLVIIYANLLNVRGLNFARRDKKLYNLPFVLGVIMVITVIIARIVYLMIGENEVFEIIEEAEEVVEGLQMVIVIVSSLQLMKTLKGTKLIKLSRVMLLLITIILALSFVSGIVSMYSESAGFVFSVIRNVLEIISFVMYLYYVHKTVEYFGEN